MAQDFKYKRVLLKLSGEALAGERGFGFDNGVIEATAEEIGALAQAGVQVGVVIGGGNMLRGAQNAHMDRSRADFMGMMATIMNSLALQDAFERKGFHAEVVSALQIDGVVPMFNKAQVLASLERGVIVICAGGTGHPYFSTDGTAVMRALEIEADAVIKCTKVDGVYDSDPKKNPNAKKFDTITYKETIVQGLAVMDTSAVAMCMENNLPLMVLNMNTPGNILRALQGQPVGTVVTL